VNETCGMVAHGSAICGEPAVEHVDVPASGGTGRVRIWLCAHHFDLRGIIQGAVCEPLQENPFD